MLILRVQTFLFIKVCGSVIQFCIDFCIFQQNLFKDLENRQGGKQRTNLQKGSLGYLKNRKDLNIYSHEDLIDFPSISALLLKENSVLSTLTALPIYTFFHLHDICSDSRAER